MLSHGGFGRKSNNRALQRPAPKRGDKTHMIERIPNPFSPNFSNAVLVPAGYSTVYIAGQAGNPPGGPLKVVAETFEEEVRLCFDNIRLALEKAGGGMKDVVRTTAYLADLSDYAIYNRVRNETFPSSPPASTTVQVAGLLVGARIEIDTIAVVSASRRQTRRGSSRYCHPIHLCDRTECQEIAAVWDALTWKNSPANNLRLFCRLSVQGCGPVECRAVLRLEHRNERFSRCWPRDRLTFGRRCVSRR